jgi:hypothetical protein
VLEVVRDYSVNGSAESIATLVDQVLCSLPTGWSRHQFIENENRQRIDPRMYVFLVPEGLQHPIANVHFAASKTAAQIARIEDQHRESLPPKEYNAIAEEFSDFCTPIAEKLGLKIIFPPDRYDIASDLTPASLRAFQQFSNRMSTSQGSERQGFLEFIAHTHRSRSPLTSNMLKRWLVEVEHWPEVRANYTVNEYAFGRELLKCFAPMQSE